MEIFNYLHLTTRRLIAVVVVAVITGVGTALVLSSDSAESYEAEVVVFVGRALPSDRSTFAIAPFAGDLEVLLALDPVRQEVAEASGIDAIAIGGLSTQQLPNGTGVAIRASARTPEVAETIASEAARVGLRTLLEQERDRAARGLAAAELRLLESRADLEQFRGDNGTQDPSVEYRLAVDALASLQVQLLNTGLDSDDRAALEDRQSQLQTEIERLAPLQAAYGELDRAVVGGESAVNQSKQEVSETEALIAGAASGDFEISTPAEVATSRSTLLAGVAAAMIVVVLLAIALFAWIDRRKGDNDEPDPADQTARPFVPVAAARVSNEAGPAATTPRMGVAVEAATSPVAVADHEAASEVGHSEGATVDGTGDGTPHAAAEHTTGTETPDDSTDDATGEAADATSPEATDPASIAITGTALNGAPTDDERGDGNQHVCTCGRVCRSAGGLSSHRRACDVYQQSLAAADGKERDATMASGRIDRGPVWVLMPDSQTSDQWDGGRLDSLLADAGLDGAVPTIVDGGGDASAQIGHAQRAISDGAGVIVLISNEHESVDTINELASGAGVQVLTHPARTPDADGDGDASTALPSWVSVRSDSR